MKKHWSYSKKKSFDSKGQRWHFVTCTYYDGFDFSESPVEFYFRNDDRTYFGLLRFERSKDNPYMFEKFQQKAMSNSDFRIQHESPETAEVWSRNWK